MATSSNSPDASCCIVIPAYNEAVRLDQEAIADYLHRSPGVTLLFVDDGSTDDTYQVLNQLAARLPVIQIHKLETNSGKAEAVRLGILRAIEMGYSYVGYWDADLATPLSEVDRFLALLHKRPDLVLLLGSRVALLGRRIERKWYRHYLGRVSATFASLVLGLPVYDTQCGAKLVRVSPETSTLFRTPFKSGWVFDVELLARYLTTFGSSQGIYEIPVDRWTDVGDSKVRPVDFLRSFGAMARIYRSYRLPQRYHRAVDLLTAPFLRYASAGAIGTAFHYCTVIVSVELVGLLPWLAAALGASIGALVNYLLNYHFIFATSRPHGETLPKFLVVALLSIVINTYSVKVGDDLGVHYLLAQMVGTALALLAGFMLNKAWTFRE